MTVYRCSVCGSDNVQIVESNWVNPNKGDEIIDSAEAARDDANSYCENCDDNHYIEECDK